MSTDSYYGSLKDLPYLITDNDIVVDAGSAFLGFTGYSKEEVVQKTISQVLNGLLRINCNVHNLNGRQEKDSYFLFTSSLNVIEVYIVVQQDLAEGQKAYVLLEKPDSRLGERFPFLESLCNESCYGIAVYSAKDFILLKVNSIYAQMLGEPFNKKESSIGLKLKELIPDFEGSDSEQRWMGIVHTGKGVYLNDFCGEVGAMKGRYWENTIMPLKLEGNVKFIVSILIDVTEKVIYRKQMEEKSRIIEQQKDYLYKIIDTLDLPIIRLGYPNLEILEINRCAISRISELFDSNRHYTEEEFKYKNIFDAFTFLNSNFEENLLILQEIKSTKNIVHRKKYELSKNGKPAYYRLVFQPILDIHNEIIEILIFAIDITSEIEENKQIEQTLKMKDEFFSFVSHEFKTPLTVINSAIQAMEVVCKDELSEKVKRFIQKIRQNSFRQLRLVNNLLDITRINSGSIKVHKKNFDIVFLTKSITESVYIYAGQKGVKLTFTSTFGRKIIGIDDEKYERILLNLLSNAIKFTPKGKHITVKLLNKKSNVCVEVKDTGVGIPEDKLELIFERFGQVDSSLSRQAEGTGIGLSLVKLFVKVLGGSISVKSKPGKGTTFTVILPSDIVEEDMDKDKKVLRELTDNRLIQATAIEFSDIYL